MPFSHIAGRTDIYTALFNGGRIVFPNIKKDSNLTFFEEIQFINPTAFGPIPRVCNKVYKEWQGLVEKMKNSSEYLGIDEKIIKFEAQKQFSNVFGNRLTSIKVIFFVYISLNT